MRLLVVTLAVICPVACEQRNTDCQWPQESLQSLDLSNRADREHLVRDVVVAEDLAVRCSP